MYGAPRAARVACLSASSSPFGLWHLSTALLPTAFHPALAQVPIYIVNATVIGFVWAQLRQRSGSIIVTSVSHGVWNGLVYVLFGYGTTIGVLGVHNTAVFGPEIGVIGLVLNIVFAGALWLLFSPSTLPGLQRAGLPASVGPGDSSAATHSRPPTT